MSDLKQIRALQTRMINNGFDVRAVATRIMGGFRRRPRAAWRLAHGMTQTEVAERYNARFGTASRAPMSATRLSAYERWPQAGERPSPSMLCRLAELYETRPADLLDDLDLCHVPESDRTVFQSLIRGDRDDAGVSMPVPGITYRQGEDETDFSGNSEEVVMAAAHEGSEHAEDAERRDIGDATLEQLRADVLRLSHEYMTGDPFATFQEMRRVRRRIYGVLDRRLWPRDQTELYFLLGVLNSLMGLAAGALGNRQAGEELFRAGWAYATAIDHHPLMGYLRLGLATNGYWQQRPRQSRDLARSGLRYTADGPNAAQLHLCFGRAAARIGDSEGARQAIAAAHEARGRDHHDELLEIGGEFSLTLATQHFQAGELLIEIPDAEREAIAELEQATSLYAAGPEPGEHHHQGCVAGSHVELATALLRGGQLDVAFTALNPVLSLPSNRRTATLLRRFDRVRRELVAPRYKGQAQAADLDENIETFCQETIVGDLRDLPAGPS